jgi:hypothetical protein
MSNKTNDYPTDLPDDALAKVADWMEGKGDAAAAMQAASHAHGYLLGQLAAHYHPAAPVGAAPGEDAPNLAEDAAAAREQIKPLSLKERADVLRSASKKSDRQDSVGVPAIFNPDGGGSGHRVLLILSDAVSWMAQGLSPSKPPAARSTAGNLQGEPRNAGADVPPPADVPPAKPVGGEPGKPAHETHGHGGHAGGHKPPETHPHGHGGHDKDKK